LADYGTPGYGSSGCPVFMEVSHLVFHLVGIHVANDGTKDRNWFSRVRKAIVAHRAKMNLNPNPPRS